MGSRIPGFSGLVKPASRNRTGRLKGYGNAINPELAAEFIMAFLEAEREL
jgi:DNA (cytosine-5)-methyltransferase 1